MIYVSKVEAMMVNQDTGTPYAGALVDAQKFDFGVAIII
jgi:hypothetical protein